MARGQVRTSTTAIGRLQATESKTRTPRGRGRGWSREGEQEMEDMDIVKVRVRGASEEGGDGERDKRAQVATTRKSTWAKHGQTNTWRERVVTTRLASCSLCLTQFQNAHKPLDDRCELIGTRGKVRKKQCIDGGGE